jgi:hypothetical protein
MQKCCGVDNDRRLYRILGEQSALNNGLSPFSCGKFKTRLARPQKMFAYSKKKIIEVSKFRFSEDKKIQLLEKQLDNVINHFPFYRA